MGFIDYIFVLASTALLLILYLLIRNQVVSNVRKIMIGKISLIKDRDSRSECWKLYESCSYEQMLFSIWRRPSKMWPVQLQEINNED